MIPIIGIGDVRNVATRSKISPEQLQHTNCAEHIIITQSVIVLALEI